MTDQRDPLDREVTAPEAAELFGIPVERIYRWRTNRDITPSSYLPGPGRAGGRPRYWLSEVAEIVAARHARRRHSRESDASVPNV